MKLREEIILVYYIAIAQTAGEEKSNKCLNLEMELSLQK